MELIDYSSSFLSLFPAILALFLAIITRRVLVSLGVGIISGALLLNDFSLIASVNYLKGLITGLVWDGTSLETHNLSIIFFLILLGMMTALLSLSGGAHAFAVWAQKRVKNKRGSTLLAFFLGVFIFVDDYFNSLAVGAISRPVTDRFNVSRPKLAYILDSTAASMCVLMPASSWGAYIITVIGGILVSHGITEYSPLVAFSYMIPMNFYAIFALLMVFAVAWFQLDIGPMKQHELLAEKKKHVNDHHDKNALQDEFGIEESKEGHVSDLVLPILVLIISTVFWMIFSGYRALENANTAFSLLGAFENTDVGSSLFFGSVVGLLSALFTLFKRKIEAKKITSTLYVGAKSMLGAVFILFFAWSIGHVIGDMATGAFLSSQLQGNLPTELLPVLLFVLSAAMAFSTGTSWGTFGIMLPIAGDLAAATEIALILPMLSAVLAGAVFGDHCSPISDTTILSATGARCDHIDHVTTQLPYALAGASIAAVSFLILGYTQSVIYSLLAGLMLFALICLSFSFLAKKELQMA